MSDTVTSIDDSTGHLGGVVDIGRRRVAFVVLRCVSDLRVQGQRRLDANKESLYVECLKHDLCHLLSVLRSVHRRLCKDEAMLLRVTPEVRVDRLMPELLDAVPVLDLSALQQETHLVSVFLRLCLFANEEVKLCVVEQLLFESALLHDGDVV